MMKTETTQDAFEAETPDRCPSCGSFGMAPCYDANGQDVDDHEGRPVGYIVAWTAPETEV